MAKNLRSLNRRFRRYARCVVESREEAFRKKSLCVATIVGGGWKEIYPWMQEFKSSIGSIEILCVSSGGTLEICCKPQDFAPVRYQLQFGAPNLEKTGVRIHIR